MTTQRPDGQLPPQAAAHPGLHPALGGPAAAASVSERAAFISRTYFHLVGAICAFMLVETALFAMPWTETVVRAMLSVSWLFILGAFLAVSWIADKWARSATSLGTQYLGLGAFVLAEAFIFLPVLWIAAVQGGPRVIPTAAVATVALFVALTLIVVLTRKDFSFLRSVLWLGGLVALALIVAGAIFSFDLGVVFTIAMIALAAGFVLYDTSNVLRRYRTDQHVAASLALFASIMLMFWYVLRLFMRRR